LHHLFRQRRILHPVPPFVSEVMVEQLHHLLRHPRGLVDRVRHMAHGDLVHVAIRPQGRPDLSAHLPMTPRRPLPVLRPAHRATPFTYFDRPSAHTVMWKRPCSSVGCCPMPRNCSRVIPISSHTGPAHCSTWSKEKVSCPAGTGVCVVKTLVARTSAAAASYVRPAAISSRTRSTCMKAACPSLACHAAGA